jgi:hypothetical protein
MCGLEFTKNDQKLLENRLDYYFCDLMSAVDSGEKHIPLCIHFIA